MFAPAFADKKEEVKFSPEPVLSYASKQTNENVTIAVKAYNTEDLAHTAFGKLHPYQYGILPVLVIVQNDTNESLALDKLSVKYSDFNGEQIDATPARCAVCSGRAAASERRWRWEPDSTGASKEAQESTRRARDSDSRFRGKNAAAARFRLRIFLLPSALPARRFHLHLTVSGARQAAKNCSTSTSRSKNSFRLFRCGRRRCGRGWRQNRG